MRSPDSIAIPFAFAKAFALIFAFAANLAVSDIHLAGLAIPHPPNSSTGFRRGGRRPNERRCADHEVNDLSRILERHDEVRVAVASRVCNQEVEARGALETEQDHRTAAVANPVTVLLRGLEDFPHGAGRVAGNDYAAIANRDEALFAHAVGEVLRDV